MGHGPHFIGARPLTKRVQDTYFLKPYLVEMYL